MAIETFVLNKATAPNDLGVTFRRNYAGDSIVSISVEGVGSVSAESNVYASQNGLDWRLLNTLTATGTNTATASFAVNEPWPYFKADVSAISGTGAVASVVLSSSDVVTESTTDLSNRLAGNDVGEGAALVGYRPSRPDFASANVNEKLIELDSGYKYRAIGNLSTEPIIESAYDVNVGGVLTNSISRKKAIVTGALTAGQPSSGYLNATDLTPDYVFLKSQSGHNNSNSSNDGRTGIYAHRVKLVQEGQGDLAAYNASVRITSPQISGATHWLANAAGVIINGTVIGESDGCYLNPLEFYLTDKPSGTEYNTTCVGAVFNLNRNHTSDTKANGGIGQVWAGIRVQSTGSAQVDNMLSGTGKFFGGVDLSMPALDFGTNKAAILVKANDRFYFNAQGVQKDDAEVFVRENWRATTGFNDYMVFDSAASRLKIVVGGAETLQVSNQQVTVSRLATTDDLIVGTGKALYVGTQKLIGGRKTGWVRVSATADSTTAFTAATVTMGQILQRIRALEDLLHLGGGLNGLIGD